MEPALRSGRDPVLPQKTEPSPHLHENFWIKKFLHYERKENFWINRSGSWGGGPRRTHNSTRELGWQSKSLSAQVGFGHEPRKSLTYKTRFSGKPETKK
jgi:hypothetical protein